MRSPLLVSFLFSTLMACGVDDPGAAGPGTKLTSTEIEPVGANCPAGGVAVHTGVDSDGNGILDATEVTATTFVCSHKTLLREDNVASGPLCPGGGVSVGSGHDVNDNGTLEDSEIESTATVCYADEMFHGDLRTSTFSAVGAQDKLSHVKVVTGDVIIDSPVALPSLTMVGGSMDVRVDPTVELPALEQITGSLTGLPRFKAPLLTSIGGNVRMTSGSSAGVFSAPSLTAVDGEFVMSGKITTVDLTALDHVGGGRLDLDVQPEKLALPALKRVAGSVIISGNFTDLDMRSLETTFGVDLVYSNLSTLSLPSLKSATNVRLGNSSRLATIEMPLVSGVKSLVLFGIPKLAVFDLPQVTALETFSLTNMAMTDLEMFANLKSIKTLKIVSNPKLVDLRGLEQLTTATTVQIAENALLEDLAGLNEIVKIAGDITIKRNASLKTLGGLARLTNVSGQITVTENLALPQAEIDAFMKRLGR